MVGWFCRDHSITPPFFLVNIPISFPILWLDVGVSFSPGTKCGSELPGSDGCTMLIKSNRDSSVFPPFWTQPGIRIFVGSVTLCPISISFFNYVIIVSPFLVVFIPPPIAEPRWLWHSPFRCLHFPRHLVCYPVYNTCYLQPILLDGAQLEVGSRYLICYPVYFDISTNPRY